MQNPFEDLIPQNQQPQAAQQNPFEDLIPQQQAQPQNVPQGTNKIPEPSSLDKFISYVMPGFPAQAISTLRSNFGQRQESLPETVASNVIDYAPYGVGGVAAVKGAGMLASKSPTLAAKLSKIAVKNPKLSQFAKSAGENMIGGAAFQAANANEGERTKEGLKGMLEGGLATGIGSAVSPLVGYAAKKYAQTAIPEFTKKATEALRSLKDPEFFSNLLGGKYSKQAAENSAHWENTKSLADKLDQSITKQKGNLLPSKSGVTDRSFTSEPYDKFVKDHMAKVKSMTPAQRESYKDSLEFAKYAQKLKPTNFKDLIDLRQNINEHLKAFNTAKGATRSDRNTKIFAKDLKDTMIKGLDVSPEMLKKSNVDPEIFNSFKNSWDNANKSTQKLQEFYKAPSSSTIKEKGMIREAFKSGQPISTKIVSQYMPKTTPDSSKGIEGLKHLEKLIGDKNQVREAAKSYLFNRQIEKGASTVDAAKVYSDLSKAQRKYIFGNSKPGKLLDEINKNRLTFGREPEKTLAKIGHGILSYGVPGAIGYGASEASGHGQGESILAGLATAAASKGGAHVLGKTATPRMVSAARKMALDGGQNYGRYINLMSQLMTRGAQK